MRFLFVETLGDGGIAHYTYNIIKAIGEYGHATSLITTYTYELKNQNIGADVYCVFFKIAFTLISRFKKLSEETFIITFLRRIIKVIEYPVNAVQCLLIAKKRRIQIVHFQSIHVIELLLVYLFRIHGYKIVFTIHNVVPGHKKLNILQRVIYALLYHWCNYLIIHSEVSRQDVIKLYWVDPKKISVVPIGDYNFFVPDTALSEKEAKKKLGLPENRRTILFFGAIRSNKGLQDILVAIPKIAQAIQTVTLMIVGEPLQGYNRYKRIMSEFGIDSKIYEMLGYIPFDEVSTYFYASEVVVLPYREVSQSAVLMLAYSFGKAVVATSVGGLTESVEEGKNGFLVPPGNPDILADRIVKILEDDKMKEEMGNHSLLLSKSKHSWAAIADKTIWIYNQLIASDDTT